jgi:Zn-dependent peptidase ImmA (M78 family)
MPKKFLEKDLEGQEYIDLLDDDIIRNLSNKYRVSAQAFINRMKNLGYIQES